MAPASSPIDPKLSVFINCPYDAEFAPLFDAIVFATGDREQTAAERGWIAGSRLARMLFTTHVVELLDKHAALPGGRVAITDWCADRWLDRWRNRLFRRLEPSHARALRAHELATLLTNAGFMAIRIERWRIGFRWGLMTATAKIPSGSATPGDSAARSTPSSAT